MGDSYSTLPLAPENHSAQDGVQSPKTLHLLMVHCNKIYCVPKNVSLLIEIHTHTHTYTHTHTHTHNQIYLYMYLSLSWTNVRLEH